MLGADSHVGAGTRVHRGPHRPTVRPVIERVDPPTQGGELTQLRGFLGYHRATLLRKVDGLAAAQLAATLPPSDMTLGGLLKHVAFNEDWWFTCVVAGREYPEPWASVDWDVDADWDWHSAAADTPEQLRELFARCVARTDAVIEAATGPDALSVRSSRSGEPFSLRWVLLHMIEEYARHNGHADLIRQSIDGAVGE
jgi:Protein of unknown function (DUF664)